MFRPRRGRAAWPVPLLLFSAVVIVAALAFNLANLNTGDDTVPAAPTSGGSSPVTLGAIDPAYVDGLLVVFGGILLAAALYVVLRFRVKREGPAKSSWWEVVTSVIGLILVLALLFSWPRMVRAFQSGSGNETSNPANSATVNVTAWPNTVGAPLGLLLAFTVLASIVAVAYLLRRGAASMGLEDEARNAADRQTAAESVQEAIVELELGGDVRTAILGCFQRFCALLGRRGITAQTPLTPRELEALAVERLQVSRGASEILTSLFEEARYSEHPLGEADRARAIDSLEGIRAALEA